MSVSFNYEKALSLEWNGRLFVLTVRNETNSSVDYLYSYDGADWSTSKDLSNSTILTSKNPYNIKWTGTNYAIIGNIATANGNTILRSNDGIQFSPMLTNISAPLYDLETNLEFQNTVTFPRNTTLALGGSSSDTTKIAYSIDEGLTWIPSANSANVFTTTANNAIWTGKTWIAVGQGGNTIATSMDGNRWVGQGSYIFTTAGYGVAWSNEQSLAVTGGSGTNSLAYSNDGVFWTGLGNTLLSTVYDVEWNGAIWVACGVPISGNKSIAYSTNGKQWSLPTQTNLFDVKGKKIGWNGSFWTVVGSSTVGNGSYNIATSMDGIRWIMQNNQSFTRSIQNMYSSLLSSITLYYSNEPIFVITGNYTTSSNANYNNIITFTGNGTISFDATLTVDTLIVGGGGGGGYDASGTIGGLAGGGGGGLGVGALSFAGNTTYNISIGNGGLSNLNGNNTTITGGTISETAYGGGSGGVSAANIKKNPGNGGSGGGGKPEALSVGYGGSATLGSGTLTYYGNSGGNGAQFEGGGGGGAGGAGGNGVTFVAGAPGANGGNGYTWPINSSIYGAGGGAGGAAQNSYSVYNSAGGTSQNGGNGASSVSGLGSSPSNGNPNTGGGGGGACNRSTNGANGGSGVVIFAYN